MSNTAEKGKECVRRFSGKKDENDGGIIKMNTKIKKKQLYIILYILMHGK